MEKVEKLTESQKITKQIIQLDKVLQKAANLIIQYFVEKSEKDYRFRDSFDLKEVWLAELEEAFRNSTFFNREGFDVVAAFDDTMYPLIEINDEAIMRILYPVLFYTLILKNYDNRDSANRRAKRSSKTWGKVGDILIVPPAEKQSNNKEAAEDAQIREKLQKLIQEAEQKENELRELLRSEFSESLLFELHEIQDLLQHAENALYLTNSSKVFWMESMAKRGLFVKSILQSQADHSKPIDTLLRLYVLDAIDGVVFWSEQMSNRDRASELPDNFLLLSYRLNDAIPVEFIRDLDYVEKCRIDIPEGTLGEELEVDDDFSALYAKLCQLKINQTDMEAKEDTKK